MLCSRLEMTDHSDLESLCGMAAASRTKYRLVARLAQLGREMYAVVEMSRRTSLVSGALAVEKGDRCGVRFGWPSHGSLASARPQLEILPRMDVCAGVAGVPGPEGRFVDHLVGGSPLNSERHS